jgi:hypothetical protein
MSRWIAGLIFAALLIVLAVVVAREHPTPMAMGMVQTTAPDAKANRLYSPCPLTPQNVPILKRENEA